MQGLPSTEAEGQSLSHALWEYHESEGRNVPEHCHDEATIFSPSQIRPFPPHCLSQPYLHLQITILVYRLAIGYKFMMNYALKIKKHRKHHFHIGPNLMCFFLGFGWHFWDPVQRLGLFQLHSLITGLVTLLFKKVFISICTVDKLFYWHQHNFDSDLHSSGMAQIWLQHDACQNFQWESHDTWFLKFQLPPLLHEWSKMNHLRTFLNVFFIFFADGHSECSLPSIEVWSPLKPLYHSGVCVLVMALSPNVYFNILKVSWNDFPNFHTNTLPMKFTHS